MQARGHEQGQAIAFLAKPESHGSSGKVERHETHGSIVFLAGDHAYKLKRAVRFSYMDYSTPELRRRTCESELAINRRTAPELYLEVRAIVADPVRGLRWGSAGELANVIDWVLVMRRFPQGALLEEMRKEGRLTRTLVLSIAEEIAAFHHRAEVKSEAGGAAGIVRVIDENLSEIRALSRKPFPSTAIEELARRTRRAFDEIAPLLDRRRAKGHVRHCHGDLHLNNICVLDGRPVPFDAIEFNPALTEIDVFYDFAFLLMDLMRHGLADLANAALNRYLERTWDYGALPALPLFLSCRAAVRAHVTMARPASPEREAEARALLDQAIAHLGAPRPRLTAIGGLSGTGKSTLAYGLAPKLGTAPGAVVLRSDIIRKRLFGSAETERLPERAYNAPESARVYATLTAMADEALRAGASVVADAVFGQEGERQAIEGVARKQGLAFKGLWLEAPKDRLLRRLDRRRGDASDANAAVLERQLTSVSPPANAAWQRLSSDLPPEICQAEAVAYLTPCS